MDNDRYWKKLVGEWFNPKYCLTKFIGAGGFGAVYIADEVIADRIMRQVALKVIEIDTNKLDKQIQELQLAVNLNQPVKSGKN